MATIRLLFLWLSPNSKGCGPGYALAAGSCEGVSDVEACTATASDAITAFAVPDPNCLSPGQSVFSGLVAPRIASQSESPGLLRTGEYYLRQPFRPSTGMQPRLRSSQRLLRGSCQRGNVHHYTPCATTAFAVPDPSFISQRRRFFRVRLLAGSPRSS